MPEILKPISLGQVPTLTDIFTHFSVLGPDRPLPSSAAEMTFETIDQPLYDTEVYAAAGQQKIQYFVVGNKTLDQSNLQGPGGALPGTLYQLVRGIAKWFIPGAPAVSNQAAGATIAIAPSWTLDELAYTNNGYFEFRVLNKPYIQEPIRNFPPTTRLSGFSSVSLAYTLAAAAAAEQQIATDYSMNSGMVRMLATPILLEPQESIQVSDNWPAAVALPSGIAGKVVTAFTGLQYRPVQ
ncbi:MAG: hypothetical protein ACYCUI_11595 [Vulcanimicrobiaceae bacterium]